MRKIRPFYNAGAAATWFAEFAALACAVAAVLGPPRSAAADAHNYATTRRQVRAAVIVSSALNVQVNNKNLAENPDPHLFYILDSRTDLKPLGMEFVNPLAPPVVTNTIYQRWQDRVRTTDPAFVAGTPESNIFRVGAPVTKNMGAYWELNVDSASDDDLKQYDVLFLHSHRNKAIFPPELKEKLRKFVEAGGTLWVENCGNMTFDPQNPFLYDVSMQADYNGSADATAVIANASHPLLSYPYALTSLDVQNLGDKYRTDPVSGGRFLLSGYYLYAVNDPTQAAPGPDAANPPGGQTLTPIIWNSRGIAANNPFAPPPGWRPLVLAGQVGAGRILFASQDTGCKINDYAGLDRPDRRNAGYGGNSQAVSGDVMAAASPPDLKFAYNIAAWTGAHTTAHTDTRHSGGTAERIAGSLSEKWLVPPAGGTWRVGGATLFKHCVYSVDGNGILHCYDTKPGEDLDGDGNADDGLPDAIYGYPFDEVWNFDLKTISAGADGASTPTCYEFYDPNSVGATGGLANFPTREQVVVALSDGKVVALRALPHLAVNGFPLAPIGTDPLGNSNPNNAIVDWILDTNTVTGQQPYPAVKISLTGAGDAAPPAPTWSEGVLFVATNATNNLALSGRVVAIDPRGTGGQGALSAFDPKGPAGPSGIDSQVPLQAGTPPFAGSPTVGYDRDNTSGALDKVIYVQSAGVTSGTASSMAIRSIPFGSKGEKLTRQTATNFVSRSTGTLPPVPWFRADPANPGNANLSLGQRVYATYTDAAGNFFSTELKFTGLASAAPGANNEYIAPQPLARGQQQMVTISPTITFPANGPVPSPGAIASGDPALNVYADYVLDWTLNPNSNPNLQEAGVRTSFPIPDTNPPGNNLLGGPPALSPDDLLYYTVDTGGTAGSSNGRGVVYAVNEQAATRSILKWTYSMSNGFTMNLANGTSVTVPPRLRQLDIATEAATGATIGTYITDVQFFGTPAFRKDVVYAVARANVGGQAASVLCAFKANPEFTLRLNTSIDKTQPVTVTQWNVFSSQGGLIQPPLTSNPSTQPGVRGSSTITVDYDSGLIHINSMANPGGVGGAMSASLPFIVQVGQAVRVVAGTQTDNVNGTQEARIIGAPGVDNLLWYAVIPTQSPALSPFGNPGFVTSSPSVQGDTIFLGTEGGFIIAIDADPAATDPAAQAAGAQIALVDDKGKLKHLRWVQRATLNAMLRSAPVADENVMVANSADGARAYEDALTVVADSNRLIEVNSGGDAVWTCEGTRTYGTAGGDIAQYLLNGQPINPNAATGVPVVQKIPFARPAVARRINTNDFMVVDTGNNRVVEIDRGGNIIWEVHRLFDDFKQLLRPGDPTGLNEPSDCAYWTEYTPSMNVWLAQNAPGYTYNDLPGTIVHYLITDTGNFRVVELVDVYNSGGQPVRPQINGGPAPFTLLRQLFFASSTYGTQGKRYRYRGVQRTLQINGALKGTAFYDPNRPDAALRRFTLAAVTNYRLGSGSGNPSGTSDEALGGGGSIMVLDETGAPVSVVTNLAIPIGGNAFKLQPINNPTSFSKFDQYDAVKKTTVFHYLLSDANGCYQLMSGLDANNNAVMIVEWMLTNDDYFHMTGKRLNAMSIRRLNTAVVLGPNQGLHHFLIANRFSGGDLIPAVFGINTNNPTNVSRGSDFNGEVFEIDPFAYDVTQANHGYVPDYSVAANILVPNNGIGGTPQASIVWRSPSETVPNTPAGSPTNPTGAIIRFIGSADRATSAANLEKPSYADRPF